MEFNNKIVVLTGGSGSGKSFYEKYLAQNGYDKLISHTTREKREKDNEQESVDYYYVSKEKFNEIDMLEITEIKNNYYGLSVNEFLSKNNNVVVVVDPNGATQIVDKLGRDKAILILLDISLDERTRNMINRGDTKEFIKSRLENEDFVNDYYRLGLEPDILINERIEDLDNLLNLVNDKLRGDKSLTIANI